jgi:hypothetical protein
MSGKVRNLLLEVSSGLGFASLARAWSIDASPSSRSLRLFAGRGQVRVFSAPRALAF